MGRKSPCVAFPQLNHQQAAHGGQTLEEVDQHTTAAAEPTSSSQKVNVSRFGRAPSTIR